MNIEDKLIQYAYEMAKSRKFIDYFFIPGVGGGKQSIEGGGLYAILIVLPSIGGKVSQPTSALIKEVMESAFRAAYISLLSGIKESSSIDAFFKNFYVALSETLEEEGKKFGENIISFYLPYQNMMFRVIALVWIQSRDLIGTFAEEATKVTVTGITEEVIGVSYHFLYALKDKKINELKENINNNINSFINTLCEYIKSEVKSYITSSSNVYSYTFTINNKTYTLYYAEGKAEPDNSKILNEIQTAMQEIKELTNYYKDYFEIIKEYEEYATEIMAKSYKSKSLYEKLFKRLEKELKDYVDKVVFAAEKINEISKIIKDCNVTLTEYGFSEYNKAMEKANSLKKDATEKCKEKLTEALKKIANDYLKAPIDHFLTEKVYNPISNTLTGVLNNAHTKVNEIAKEAAGKIGNSVSDFLKKVPVIGSIYAVADIIHRIFTNTITKFHYDVIPPEEALVEIGEEIKYYKDYGKSITGDVGNGQWAQGCIKGLMAGLIGMISTQAAEVLNYIPQVLIFDIDFTEKVITGGKPGFYSLCGTIEFENVYSSINKFIRKTIKDFIQSENIYSIYDKNGNSRYSIFSEDIKEELNSLSPKEENTIKQKTSIQFIVPYIVGSVFSVIGNVMEIEKDYINVKMVAILDIGSFLRPAIREVASELKKELSNKVNTFINFIIKKIKEHIEKLLESFKEDIEGIVKKAVGEISDWKKEVLYVILSFAANSIADHIMTKLSDRITTTIQQLLEKILSPILTCIFERIDVTSEKLGDIISITLNVIAIPVRGMGEKLKIVIPSINIVKSIDNFGYCDITISKKDLLNFSAPISAIRSYIAFSDGDSIGMIPYSAYSYEPLVIQVFTKIISWPNEFKVMHIINPEEEIEGVSIEIKNELIGTKLVILRGNNDKNVELRCIPNPYPYAEAYVKLNIG